MNELIKKYILPHAHPAKFVAEVVGIGWGSYFLWQHNWIVALVGSFVLFLLSTILLWNKQSNLSGIEKTSLGKIMMAYSTPFRFMLYNISIVPLVYGLWTHSWPYIVVAICILFIPQIIPAGSGNS